MLFILAYIQQAVKPSPPPPPPSDNVVVIKNFDSSVRSGAEPRPESASLRRPTTAVRKRPSSGIGAAGAAKPSLPPENQPIKPLDTTPITNKKSEKTTPAAPKKIVHNFFDIHPIIKELEFLRKPKSLLDPAGDRFEFPQGHSSLTRGSMPYHQPTAGWIRYGLNIKLVYPNISEWLSKNGNPKEWAVGYTGFKVNPLQSGLSAKLFDKNKKFNPSLTPSRNLNFASDKDTNKASVAYDKPCGLGIFLSNKVELAEASTVAFALNGVKYKMLLQCRIEPTHVRIPQKNTNLFIVNSTEHVRPYALLIKELD